MLLVVLGCRNAEIPRSKHLMVCRLILQPLEVLTRLFSLLSTAQTSTKLPQTA